MVVSECELRVEPHSEPSCCILVERDAIDTNFHRGPGYLVPLPPSFPEKGSLRLAVVKGRPIAGLLGSVGDYSPNCEDFVSGGAGFVEY